MLAGATRPAARGGLQGGSPLSIFFANEMNPIQSAHRNWRKIIVIIFMITGILLLHYLTPSPLKYHHAVYRILFYLPLILGSFWFGLKGALYVSIAVFFSIFPT